MTKKKIVTTEQDMNRFLKGYQKFRAHYFSKDRKSPLYKKLLREGQSPKIMVIACSDSRVDPSIILGALPGELFVVRNVANLVPPFDNNPKHHGTSAALEFAVQVLGVSHIIVLGHSHCGGIQALLKPLQDQQAPREHNFITSWMNIASAAREKVSQCCQDQPPEVQAKLCEEESLLISLNNLRTFPWIDSRVQAGLLSLHAWHFDLRTGVIEQFNQAHQQFEELCPLLLIG